MAIQQDANRVSCQVTVVVVVTGIDVSSTATFRVALENFGWWFGVAIDRPARYL